MELSVRPAELVAWSAHARPASIVSPLTVAPIVHPPVLHPVLIHGLQLFPLVRLQLHPNVQQKKRIRLFQLCARAHDLVGLRFNRRAVRSIGLHQRSHLQLHLLQIGLQVDQLHAMVLQNSIHYLALIVGQVQLLHDVRVVPEPSVRESERAFDGRPILLQSRSHAWSVGPLRAHPTASHQHPRYRQNQS